MNSYLLAIIAGGSFFLAVNAVAFSVIALGLKFLDRVEDHQINNRSNVIGDI